MPLKTRLHIVTEGQKTERDYISDIRISKRISTAQVVLLPHKCNDPLSLIEQLVEHMGGREFDPETDEAWAAFDADEHRHDHKSIQRYNQAIALAKKSNIQLAVSSPCIELWLLLHFERQTAFLDRAEARRKLKVHLADYDKSLPTPLLTKLRPGQATAHGNAEHLATRAGGPAYKDEPVVNPTTGFHLLIKRIQTLT